MLTKYGEKIRLLEIDDSDKWLYDLVEQNCCNLTNIKLISAPRMISLKNMKEVRLVEIQNLNRETFAEFINNNQQLETLEVTYVETDLLDILDGRLNMLKTLDYSRENSFTNDLPKIKLNALETLNLNQPTAEDYVRLLQAMNRNNLKSLLLSSVSFIDLDDAVIDEICSFKMLLSLQLTNYKITKDQLKKMAKRLPHIIEFGMGITEDVENCIHSVLRIFPKLTKLTIRLGATNFRHLSDDLKKSIHDFHARFAGTDTEIEIFYDGVHFKRSYILL